MKVDSDDLNFGRICQKKNNYDDLKKINFRAYQASKNSYNVH